MFVISITIDYRDADARPTRETMGFGQRNCVQAMLHFDIRVIVDRLINRLCLKPIHPLSRLDARVFIQRGHNSRCIFSCDFEYVAVHGQRRQWPLL